MAMSECSIRVGRPYFMLSPSKVAIHTGTYCTNRSELLMQIKRMPAQSRKPASAMQSGRRAPQFELELADFPEMRVDRRYSAKLPCILWQK